MNILSMLLRLVGIAIFLAYFFLDSVSSIFVPIIGVALYLAGRMIRGTIRGMAKSALHMSARRGDITEMKDFLGLARPYLKAGGRVLAMKGPLAGKLSQELEGLSHEFHEVAIPFANRTTSIIIARK